MYLLQGALILYKFLSHFLIFAHHCAKNHGWLIYKLDIFTIEINRCSHCSFIFFHFLAWGVLRCEFLKMTVFWCKIANGPSFLSPDFMRSLFS